MKSPLLKGKKQYKALLPNFAGGTKQPCLDDCLRGGQRWSLRARR